MSRQPASNDYTLVKRPDQIAAVCEQARSESRFAFDTEFVMEDRYEPEVCLIQLATETTVALIDPYLDLDLDLVWQLVCDPAVETVVHAGQEDLALCVQHTGKLPKHVFDVQIAAGLVGYEYPISLQKLIQAALHIRLHKAKTLTDWRRRPLTPAQLRYAAEDVCHLLAVRRKLHERLVNTSRVDWAKEEFRRFEDISLYGREDVDKLRRVKGTAALKGRALLIARELLTWRDDLARHLNRPPRAILKDHLLVEIARLQLAGHSEIRDLRGINLSDKHVQALGMVVQHAMTLPIGDKPIEKSPEFESPQETVLIALATAVIRSYCLEKDLAYSLVATKKSIRDLIRHRSADHPSRIEDVELLNGWRAETVGALLDDLLAGKRTVRVEPVNGELLVHVK